VNKTTISVEGLDALQRDFSRISDETRAGLSLAVKATALDINRDVKKRILRGPKTGRIYTRGGGQNLSATHQASAPGESPATDTGELARRQYYTQENSLSATIGSRLVYAYFLEFGTRTIAARPTWIPAIEAITPKFNQRVDKVLKEATR
jgi:hypothetical protein